MKTIILSLILLGSTFNAFAAEKKESMARTWKALYLFCP